ncbi:MAG: chorismate mutase, partial [Oscillospiraceae bacterium]|nr:chorismate mutase [Oscillospiraceae bacterium]
MESISKMRDEMNTLNENLLEIFLRRMSLSKEIITLKLKRGLEVYDPAREDEIIGDMTRRAGRDEEAFVRRFFVEVLELCR